MEILEQEPIASEFGQGNGLAQRQRYTLDELRAKESQNFFISTIFKLRFFTEAPA